MSNAEEVVELKVVAAKDLRNKAPNPRGWDHRIIFINGREFAQEPVKNDPGFIEGLARFLKGKISPSLELPEFYKAESFSYIIPMWSDLLANGSLANDDERVFVVLARHFSHYKAKSRDYVSMAKNHLKAMEGFQADTLEDLFYMMDPVRSPWGRDDYPYVSWLPQNLLEVWGSPDHLDFAKRMVMVEHCVNVPSGRLSALPLTSPPPQPLVENSWHSRDVKFVDLPVHIKMYRNYLLEQEPATIKKFFGRVTRSLSGSAAITMSEEIANGDVITPEERILLVSEVHSSIVRKSYKNNNSYHLVELYTLLDEEKERHHTLKLLKDYMDGFPEETIPYEDLTALIRLLITTDVTKWVKVKKHSDSVISQLKKHLSTNEIVGMLGDFVENVDEALTTTRWERYIADIDIYRDTPPALWAPVVK